MKLLRYGILLAILLSFSCETVVDCLLKINPYIEDKNLSYGNTMQSYEDFIIVRVENAADENYTINTISIEGDLPPGISSTYNDRKISFTGIPTQFGTFNFKVTVVLVDNDPTTNNDDLCGNTTSKSFQITIN